MKFKNKKTGEIIEWDVFCCNSSLVSAQNRVRLYWTNIPGVTQPEDKGIFIKDIIEDEVDEKYYISNKALRGLRRHRRRHAARGNGFGFKPTDGTNKKSNPLSAYGRNGANDNYLVETSPNGITNLKKGSTGKSWFFEQQTYTPDSKSRALKAGGGSGNIPKVLIGAIRGRYLVDGKRQDHKIKTAGMTTQRLEVREDEKSNCLTTVQKDNVLVDYPRVRKMTPIECERLQTVPDNYTDIVSNSQRYKMLGNGWTIDVPAHIFKGLKR